MKNKNIKNIVFYYTTFVYLELIFRIFCTEILIPTTFINTLLFLIPVSLLLSIISSLLSEKKNKIIAFIIIPLISILYGICTVYKLKLDVFFSLSSLGLANQLTAFMGDTFKTIQANIIPILLLFIPLILLIIFNKYIDFKVKNKKTIIIYLISFLITSLIYVGSLFVNKNNNYSLYTLYYKENNNSLTVEKVGVLPSMLLEIRNIILPPNNSKIDDHIYIDENNTSEVEEKEISYNTLSIDFDKNSNDKTISTMNEYFKNEIGTKKNDYTGLYKDKNLILFMAESFNEVAVSEELTPTLYKLSHEGFVFDNFYSPVILSTIGGEFQELTGLYPHLDLLSRIWRKGTNYYPYGFGNVFNNIGYKTYAYHNNQYNFQSRNNYLKSLGFNNYKGCWNGLEKKINCKIWPESDAEMINATVDDYINNEEKFMTYYVTVSGHMSYNWGNSMSAKHKNKVKDLPYSETVKAYIATQIELDSALENLIIKLEEAGKLDDTVIALVGDHYPYDLTLNQINEMSTYKRDNIIEINHSNFILWNNNTETIKVSKVGSQIDVLPTILNLFGVDYDSRLIIGKDILSDTEGLAIFSNNSWVTDQGKYFSHSNKFVPNEGYEVDNEYISNMNKTVSTKMNMGRYILEKNYYKYVFNDLIKNE